MKPIAIALLASGFIGLAVIKHDFTIATVPGRW